jgi:hypothetical protein
MPHIPLSKFALMSDEEIFMNIFGPGGADFIGLAGRVRCEITDFNTASILPKETL